MNSKWKSALDGECKIKWVFSLCDIFWTVSQKQQKKMMKLFWMNYLWVGSVMFISASYECFMDNFFFLLSLFVFCIFAWNNVLVVEKFLKQSWKQKVLLDKTPSSCNNMEKNKKKIFSVKLKCVKKNGSKKMVAITLTRLSREKEKIRANTWALLEHGRKNHEFIR